MKAAKDFLIFYNKSTLDHPVGCSWCNGRFYSVDKPSNIPSDLFDCLPGRDSRLIATYSNKDEAESALYAAYDLACSQGLIPENYQG